MKLVKLETLRLLRKQKHICWESFGECLVFTLKPDIVSIPSAWNTKAARLFKAKMSQSGVTHLGRSSGWCQKTASDWPIMWLAQPRVLAAALH